jgi:hypothetical protein
MNIRKLFVALLCVIYVYTNQLGIHVFAMHWELLQNSTEVSTQENCWHNNTHNSDNNKSNMDCLTQVKDVLSSEYDSVTIDTTYVAHDNNIAVLLYSEKQIIDQYYYSINDPGRWDQGNFSKFLDDLYGKGVVMID